MCVPTSIYIRSIYESSRSSLGNYVSFFRLCAEAPGHSVRRYIYSI